MIIRALGFLSSPTWLVRQTAMLSHEDGGFWEEVVLDPLLRQLEHGEPLSQRTFLNLQESLVFISNLWLK
jgi:hypothetical protein